MRLIIAATLGLAVIGCSAPSAEQKPSATQAPASDQKPSTKTAGSLFDRWTVRLDDPSAKPDAVTLQSEKDAVTITSGPAGIYYKDGEKAEKDYTVSATFSQLKPTPKPVEYGLFISGADLDKPAARYTALVVRGDGKYRIVTWNAGKATTVVDWTTAAPMMEPKGAKTSNTLTIRALQDAVHFLIGDKELHQMPRAKAGEDGIAGVRFGPGLSLQVSKFEKNKFP